MDSSWDLQGGWVKETHVDAHGRVYTQLWPVDGFDEAAIDARVAKHGDQLLARLAEAEIEALIDG